MRTIQLLLAVSGCGEAQRMPEDSRGWGGAVNRPLNAASLSRDTFLVVTDLWASVGPDPDTPLFHEDGSVTNRRAGLVGPWRIRRGRDE